MKPDEGPSPYQEPGAQPVAVRRPRIFYGWYLVAAAILISAVAGGASDSISTFQLPMQKEFGLSYTALVYVLLIGALVSGLSQPIIGHLCDRFNSRRVIWISIAVAGLAIVALSRTFHYWHLIVLVGIVFPCAMGGASFGILGPLAARWFMRRRTSVLSLLVAGSAVGSLLLTPISASVLTYFGWRNALMALGAILLFIALPAALIYVRNWPSERGLKPDGDPESPMEARARGSAPVLRRGRFEVEGWSQALRSPPFWVILFCFALEGLVDFSASVALWLFAVDSLLLGPEFIAVTHSVMLLLGPVGAVAAGLVADRFARKQVLGALLLAQGIAFLVLIVVPFGFSLLLFAILVGLSGAAWMVIALSLIADIYGLLALATLWGIAFLFQAIGSVIGPVTGGLAIELTGSYHLYFGVCASMLVLVSIAVLRINERKYSARYQGALELDAVDD